MATPALQTSNEAAAKSGRQRQWGLDRLQHNFAEAYFAVTETLAHWRLSRRKLALALALISPCTVLALTFHIALRAYVDGEPVGLSLSASDFAAAVEAAEETASQALGHPCSFEDSVSYRYVVENRSTYISQSALERALLATVPGLVQGYLLQIDGEVVAASTSYSDLSALLSERLNTYNQTDADESQFLGDVQIVHGYAAEDLLLSTQEIQEILAQQSVYTVSRSARVASVPYAVDYYDDPTIYEGDSEVASAGVDGAAIVETETMYLNGEVASTQETMLQVLEEPINQQVANGTMERPLTASWGYYIWPTSGTITSNFGYRSGGVGSTNHKGLDIATAHGSNILAADGGEVIYADWMSGYGYLVQVQHDNGDVTYYAHCSQLLVSVGQRVYQGELIAYVGNTGVSSGSHLHFEVRVGDTPQNPLNYLP